MQNTIGNSDTAHSTTGQGNHGRCTTIPGNTRRRLDSRLIAGGLLILIGILVFIDRSYVTAYSVFDILALVAVLAGSVSLINARSHKDAREGAWWIFLGLWFYFSYHQIMGYGFGDTWPLLIIAWGIGHIWRALEPRAQYGTDKDR